MLFVYEVQITCTRLCFIQVVLCKCLGNIKSDSFFFFFKFLNKNYTFFALFFKIATALFHVFTFHTQRASWMFLYISECLTAFVLLCHLFSWIKMSILKMFACRLQVAHSRLIFVPTVMVKCILFTVGPQAKKWNLFQTQQEIIHSRITEIKDKNQNLNVHLALLSVWLYVLLV